MNTPSAEQAHGEGYDARMCDRSESTNPYDLQADEFLSWNAGWLAADEELAEK